MVNPVPSYENLLNESQERHLLANCQYIDSLLTDVESVLTASDSRSAFPKFKSDLTPVQAKITRDHVARVRQQILESLKSVHLVPPEARFGSIHSIRVSLTFADIAIEECTPARMRGYGEVKECVRPVLNGLVEEIKGSIHKLAAFLNQGTGQDFQSRLAKIQQSSHGTLVQLLERIIDRHGLIEFRPALAAILDRMENRSLEIAFFGRVSSGKSSLLNQVLGTDILPVGVTPVTAVPTRIQWAENPALEVCFAHKSAETFPLERLPDFVAESANRGNHQHVTRLTLKLPSPVLKTGIVLVDTPGLGSLAASGTAETLTYLPHCDLGVVLVDAASTLTENDLATIRALHNAAVPVNVVLSKADLLTGEDLSRSIDYTTAHLARELGWNIAVHPVSSVMGREALLEEWFHAEITPLFQRQTELAGESLGRKIRGLAEQLKASLNFRLRATVKQTPQAVARAREVRLKLQNATGLFESTREKCLKAVDQISISSSQAIHRIAEASVEEFATGTATYLDGAWVADALAKTAAGATATIAESLTKLAHEVTAVLRDTALSLSLNDPPLEQDFISLLKEMPMLDAGSIEIELRVGFLTRKFPQLARRQIESKLQGQIGQQTKRMFSSFQTLMVGWIRRSLAAVRTRFESYAEIYRAQLAADGSSENVADATDQSIRQDLDEIQSLLPSMILVAESSR